MSLTAGCFALLSFSVELCQLPLKHVGPVPELLVPDHLFYKLWWALPIAQLDLSDICANAQWNIWVYIPGILATFFQVKHFIKTITPIVVLILFTFSVTSTQRLQMRFARKHQKNFLFNCFFCVYLSLNVVSCSLLSVKGSTL